MRGHSLRVLRDGVALNIWYLRAIYRDEGSRSVVRGEPDEVVECLRPGRRECLGGALEHTMVEYWYVRVRGGEGGQEGEEEEGVTQHVRWASGGGKGNLVILLRFMFRRDE
jgi:hypothetical protein